MQTNLILAPGDPLEYDDLIDEALIGLMLEDGPNIAPLGRRQIDAALTETVWNDNEAGAADVRLMCDTDIPAQWVAVQAADKLIFDAIVLLLRDELPVQTYDELRAAEARPGGLTNLALTHDPRLAIDIVPLVTRALQSESAQRRGDAAMAAQLAASPGTAPALREALAREQDKGVAAMLASASEKIGSGDASP